jgi:hypothetical protein
MIIYLNQTFTMGSQIANFNHSNPTLFVFSNIEVAPGKGSKLTQSKPSVRGAFVHCLCRASSVLQAEADVRQALNGDNYNVLELTTPIIVSEADVNESVFADEWKQRRIKPVGPEVYYSDFFCF